MTLEEMWALAAADLGFMIDVPYVVKLPGGGSVRARIRVRGFGHTNGMLIVTRFSEISPYTDELHRLGYGFSTLGDPLSSEGFCRKSFIEMLADWGWTGPPATPPRWLFPDHDPSSR